MSVCVKRLISSHKSSPFLVFSGLSLDDVGLLLLVVGLSRVEATWACSQLASRRLAAIRSQPFPTRASETSYGRRFFSSLEMVFYRPPRLCCCFPRDLHYCNPVVRRLLLLLRVSRRPHGGHGLDSRVGKRRNAAIKVYKRTKPLFLRLRALQECILTLLQLD